jgi:hypothetical protein
MSTATKTAPKIGAKEITPKEVSPVDEAFWDSAALAALGGASSEVRLTADEIVRKAVNCADKMMEARASPQPAGPAGCAGAGDRQHRSDQRFGRSHGETSSFSVTVATPAVGPPSVATQAG